MSIAVVKTDRLNLKKAKSASIDIQIDLETDRQFDKCCNNRYLDYII